MTPPSVHRTVTETQTGSSALTAAENTYASFEANALHNLVQLGYLAERQGDRPQLKLLGQDLYQDFSRNQEELTEATLDESFVRRGTFDSDDQATYNSLRGMSGSGFDRAFLTALSAELTSIRAGISSMRSSTTGDLQTHAAELDSDLSRFQTLLRDLETLF
jgi:hypothetical protein